MTNAPLNLIIPFKNVGFDLKLSEILTPPPTKKTSVMKKE